MKNALLVGINHYPFITGSDLRGCVNDVDDLSYILKKTYKFDSVVNMLDDTATAHAILYFLKQMIINSKAGDTLVFGFSGHGTQVKDIDNFVNGGDETDSYDEALCCADMGSHTSSGLIVDDEIYDAIKELPKGVSLSFIIDACHSGTVTKDIAIKPKRIIISEVNKHARRICQAIFKPQRHILLSACRSDQTAADAVFGGKHNGALTKSVITSLEKNPNQTWRMLVTNCIEFMKKEAFPQRPELFGIATLADEIVFGGTV